MGYVLKRLGYVFPVMLVVTLATASLMDLLPGDAALVIAGEFADDDDVAAIREELGLDKPFLARYVDWLTSVASGDFGRSFITEDLVLETILSRLWVSIELMLLSELIGLALAIPTGIWCAYRAGSAIDRAIMGGTFIILAAPAYVIAILLILTVAIPIPWIPAIGFTSPSESVSENLLGMLLPALTIGLASWPGLARIVRSDVIGTLQQDYIALAKAKGLTNAQILVRHALRPSSLTLVAILGVSIASRIDGVIVIETLFAIPGMGRLLIESIYAHDYLLVQGLVLFIAVFFVSINLIVDLLLAVIDPRIRHR